MKLGFTGTRNGMSLQQIEAFRALVEKWLPTEFHHGDCIGADDQAADIVHLLLPSPRCLIICHPPLDEAHRAFNKYTDYMREAKAMFARNRDIVNETFSLVGTPLLMEPMASGGTWYTLDYGKKQNHHTTVIWPDGRLECTCNGPENVLCC